MSNSENIIKSLELISSMMVQKEDSVFYKAAALLRSYEKEISELKAELKEVRNDEL